jgi:hypothetical protein
MWGKLENAKDDFLCFLSCVQWILSPVGHDVFLNCVVDKRIRLVSNLESYGQLGILIWFWINFILSQFKSIKCKCDSLKKYCSMPCLNYEMIR